MQLYLQPLFPEKSYFCKQTSLILGGTWSPCITPMSKNSNIIAYQNIFCGTTGHSLKSEHKILQLFAGADLHVFCDPPFGKNKAS